MIIISLVFLCKYPSGQVDESKVPKNGHKKKKKSTLYKVECVRIRPEITVFGPRDISVTQLVKFIFLVFGNRVGLNSFIKG